MKCKESGNESFFINFFGCILEFVRKLLKYVFRFRFFPEPATISSIAVEHLILSLVVLMLIGGDSVYDQP